MKKFILFLLAVVLAACSAGPSNDFSSNRDKWQQAGIPSYRYSLMFVCFCAFSDKMPLTIEVRDGEPVAITYTDGTTVAQTDPNYEHFARYATIDRIFADLETNLNGGADEVIVSYDATYGYPSQIDYDYIKEAIDDELSLTITSFEVLE
jgi:hypothetical protein